MKTTFQISRQIVNNLFISCLFCIMLLFLSGCERTTETVENTLFPIVETVIQEKNKMTRDQLERLSKNERLSKEERVKYKQLLDSLDN